MDGEYIVVLKDSGTPARALRAPGDVREKAEESTDSLGGETRRTYTTALKGFSIEATEKQARRLAAHPDVAYVEANRVERGDDLPAGQGTEDAQADPAWGLDRVDQRNLPLDGRYEYDTRASNVTAYIIDSGINIAHRDFRGRASYGYNFVDGTGTASDCHGHGTHVAGTVGSATHGVAKGVRLVAVKVLDCRDSGTTEGVPAGYDRVARNAVKPAVANVGIGGSASDAKDAAVRKMVQAGITVTASAGAVALCLSEKPEASPAEVRGVPKLLATIGRVTDVGAGSPNRLPFTNF